MDDSRKQALQAQALDWLQTKWTTTSKQCPICADLPTNWGVGEAVEARLFAGGNLFVGGPLYVFIPVSCNNCGYTLFFNATIAGVVPEFAAEAEPEPSSEKETPKPKARAKPAPEKGGKK